MPGRRVNCSLEPLKGVEIVTPAVSRKCSVSCEVEEESRRTAKCVVTLQALLRSTYEWFTRVCLIDLSASE